MNIKTWLRAFLEGRRGGLLSILARGLLLPLGILYGCAMAIRARLFAAGVCPSYRPAIPVISVGNLTVGGTGKTPFVITLCERLIVRGERPAILTRGYGATIPAAADEPKVFAQHLPDTPVFISPDRVASAEKAEAAGATVLVLDDGFQHLRLARDLDIVLLDASCPWGGGWPLPAGLLRGFPGSLKRADLFCLTRTDQTPPPQLEKLRATLTQRFAKIPMIETSHIPLRLESFNGESVPLESLQGKPIIAVSGIGRPTAFRQTLVDLGAEIKQTFDFPDHHIFTLANIANLHEAITKHADTIVTTEKDAVKLHEAITKNGRENDFDTLLTLIITIDIVDNFPLEAAISTCKKEFDFAR